MGALANWIRGLPPAKKREEIDLLLREMDIILADELSSRVRPDDPEDETPPHARWVN